MSALPALSRLPIPLTPLIGRERETALACALLTRPHVRLLTITGSGGIGKTRLGLEVAARVSADIGGAVCYVPLAAVADAAFVLDAIAAALRVPESVEKPLVESVVALLRDTETLLLVDNFEQVLDAAPILTELLEACPRVRMIVTSRTLLHVTGEQALPVPPLSLPEAGSSLDHLVQSPAIRLFMERAQAVQPDFTLSAATALQAAEVCRRLDGMPLAIELAAARLTHLSIGSLEERLQQRLPMLTSRARDRPDRHRTLRTAIAWSHDLLTSDQQALFRRIAVFASGFTIDAAGALVDRLDVEEKGGDFLEGIASLVNTSLLDHVLLADGSSRYRMLETIREFAAEQLAQSGEDRAARRAHATYFLEFAERHAWEPFLQRDTRQLVQLDGEDANLRAALDWLAADSSSADFPRLACVLGWLWFLRGRLHDSRIWLEKALGRGDATPTDQVKLRLRLGMIALTQGDFPRAEEVMSGSLDAAQRDSDALDVAQVRMALGCLAIAQGLFEAGNAQLREAHAAAQLLEDPIAAGLITGEALANLGIGMRGLGLLDEAVAYHEQALNQQRALGDAWGELHSLGDLGDAAQSQGDDERAAHFYREALLLANTVGDHRSIVDAMEGLAAVEADAHPEKAVRLFGAAEHLREATGIAVRGHADGSTYARGTARARERLGDAAFAAGWLAGRSLPSADALAEATAPAPAPVVAPGTPFTPRESEVLLLLAAGLPDRAIAEALFLSVRTVENHVKHILAKLNARTRTAAVSAAIAAGYVDRAALPHP